MFTGLSSPDGGWEQNTFYLVEISLRLGNPMHRAIFYSGFLNHGEPGSYSQLWSPFYDAPIHKKDLSRFVVIRKIIDQNEFRRVDNKDL